MANLNPNAKCPCGADFKFKKCCRPFLEGEPIRDAERLIRARHAALVTHDATFLWKSLHPFSPRRLGDREENFRHEITLLKSVAYEGFTLIDKKSVKSDDERFVFYVRAQDSGQDVSYLEEAQVKRLESQWLYFDGLRKPSARLGCLPESLKVGELETLFLHESGLN